MYIYIFLKFPNLIWIISQLKVNKLLEQTYIYYRGDDGSKDLQVTNYSIHFLVSWWVMISENFACKCVNWIVEGLWSIHFSSKWYISYRTWRAGNQTLLKKFSNEQFICNDWKTKELPEISAFFHHFAGTIVGWSTSEDQSLDISGDWTCQKSTNLCFIF